MGGQRAPHNRSAEASRAGDEPPQDVPLSRAEMGPVLDAAKEGALPRAEQRLVRQALAHGRDVVEGSGAVAPLPRLSRRGARGRRGRHEVAPGQPGVAQDLGGAAGGLGAFAVEVAAEQAADLDEPSGRRGRQGDRRTIGGRSVSALNGVALAVIFGDCIRVQIPASSSFASIWLRAEAENTQDILLLVVLT